MHKPRVGLILLALVSSALSSISAPASALLATSQDRFVESAAGIGTLGPVDRRSAPDFGLFDETSVSSVTTGIGRATQASALSAIVLRANGAVFTSGISAGIGLARSHFEVVFEVSESTSYSLNGSVFGSGDAATSVRLLGAGGVLLQSASANPIPGVGDVDLPFSFVGVLAPGEYTLRALTGSCSDEISFCGLASGRGSYSVVLNAVPEPSMAFFIGLGLAGLSMHRLRPRGVPARRDRSERGPGRSRRPDDLRARAISMGP